MECGYARLTVWFADPFWVGVYEREAEGRLEGGRPTPPRPRSRRTERFGSGSCRRGGAWTLVQR